MTAVTCECGRVCASRSGFATHARKCPRELERRERYVAAIERREPRPEVWETNNQPTKGKTVSVSLTKPTAATVDRAECRLRTRTGSLLTAYATGYPILTTGMGQYAVSVTLNDRRTGGPLKLTVQW